MSIINKGTAFSNGEQLTADKLNNLVDLATFDQSATDSASTTVNSSGQIAVADGGITSAKLATDAVETNKIANDAVQTAKILDANVTFAKLTDVIDDDTMATATATTTATSESIKAYVDANALTPSYVGISSNSSLTITQNDTSTTTHTYPIADFVGAGFNAAKVTGFYVEITALCRYLSTTTIADVKATFPDGNDHILLGHSCQSPEDQVSQSRGTVFCPVTQGQTNLVIKPTLSGNTKRTIFTIVGCTQFV